MPFTIIKLIRTYVYISFFISTYRTKWHDLINFRDAGYKNNKWFYLKKVRRYYTDISIQFSTNANRIYRSIFWEALFMDDKIKRLQTKIEDSMSCNPSMYTVINLAITNSWSNYTLQRGIKSEISSGKCKTLCFQRSRHPHV